MSIQNYLSKIKSAGVYRYVFDKSEVPVSERHSIRLVVGYSERGQFNTPVYISDTAEFISTFGNISRRLERKGIFFHRLALQALEAGPILALNIKPFKNESAKMITFNMSDMTCEGEMEIKIDADSVELTGNGGEQKFFVKPVPDYSKDGDSFKFVGSSSKDATYIRTIEGGKEIFWTADGVEGAIYEDGKLIYAHFNYTHTFFNNEFIKNKDGIITIKGKQEDVATHILDDALIALDGTNVAGEKLNTIYDTNRFWKITPNIMDITPMASGSHSKTDYMRIVQTSSKEDSVTVFIRPVVPVGYDIKIADWFAQETAQDIPYYLESLRDHYLSEFFCEVFVFRGDFRSNDLFAESGTLGTFVRTKDAESYYPFCIVEGKGIDAVVRTNSNYRDPFGYPSDALSAMSEAPTANFIGRYQGITLPNFTDTNGVIMSIDAVFNEDFEAHKCLMALNEQLLDDAYEADQEEALGNMSMVKALVSASVHEQASGVHGDDINEPIKSVPANASIVGYYLEGYNYTTIQKGESGRSLIEDKIMPVIGYKGINEALTNSVDIDYKYWVDTFQGYPGISMKADIAATIKKKFNALGILNFPPMVDCATFLGYPGLVGGFNMKNVVRRGSGITLPAEVQGASWVAFYTQLQMTDGTNKFNIPSAALVSNLFIEKRDTRQPYYVVAGPNYGRIEYPGLLGPDYNYSRADIDSLEPFGVNTIVYVPRRGVLINGNQTAKQTPVTALSKVHIRELVTYLQDTVENVLTGYQWELNTSTLRDMVRAKCEVILDIVKANGGIYEYRVTCDDSNNTPETIDNEMLIVDIEIEPGRSTSKMIQTLTIHRTGGMSVRN